MEHHKCHIESKRRSKNKRISFKTTFKINEAILVLVCCKKVPHSVVLWKTCKSNKHCYIKNACWLKKTWGRMVLFSVLSIVVGLVFSFCSLIILQYLKNKPLGMQTLFDLMLADVVFVCDLIFGWIFIIIINLPTSPEFSQPFAIVLSGKTLLLGL